MSGPLARRDRPPHRRLGCGAAGHGRCCGPSRDCRCGLRHGGGSDSGPNEPEAGACASVGVAFTVVIRFVTGNIAETDVQVAGVLFPAVVAGWLISLRYKDRSRPGCASESWAFRDWPPSA